MCMPMNTNGGGSQCTMGEGENKALLQVPILVIDAETTSSQSLIPFGTKLCWTSLHCMTMTSFTKLKLKERNGLSFYNTKE